MLLHRRSRSSRGFIVACTGVTLYHQVNGFPVVVKKAAMMPRDSSSLRSILPNSDDARWLNSSENPAAASALVPRSLSSNAVVHDKLFIPAIVSIGVLVIICAFCCYQLITNKEPRHPIPTSQGRYSDPPIFNSQHAIGRQGNGHGGSPLSRGPSKVKKSLPSVLSSRRGSPSVHSDTIGYHHHLQQQRLQQQLLEQQQQQQDPLRQYLMAHNHGRPWQHQQPSVAGSAMQHGEGVQLQPPSVQMHATRTIGPDPTGSGRNPSVVQTVQPPFTNATLQQPPMHQTPMNPNPVAGAGWDQYRVQQEYQKLQQQQQPQQPPPQPISRTSHVSSAQTSSTRVTSDILSYMTPPEARRTLLNSNQSQPQNQDYFNGHRAGSNINPSHTGGSTTHGMSVPGNYNTASQGPSPKSAHSAHGSTTIHVQPPSYTETKNNDIQGKTTTTRKSEKSSPSNMNV